MAFMVMKLTSGSKTYSLKITKDDFVAIQKEPSLLAEYWDQVLDEKEQEEKPQVGRPAKRRSKSVGAEARGKKRIVPHDEETVTNGTIHSERKKSRSVNEDGLISQSVSPEKATKSPEIPVSVQNTNSVDDTGDPDAENKIKSLDSGNEDSPASNKKVKALKGSDKLDEKGDKKARKHLSNSKSVFKEEAHVEPKEAPVCGENIEEHFSTGCTESELCVKDKKILVQPIKSYSKGFRKPKKGVDFQSLEEQVVIQPSKSSVNDENIQVHNSSEAKPVSSVKNVVKTIKQAIKSDRKDIPSDPHVTQVVVAPKRRGRKRKHVEVACKEFQMTPKRLDQDADSTTVPKNTSRDGIPCSPHAKSNEKVVHDLISCISPSENVTHRRSVRQQQRQQKQDEIKRVAFLPDVGSVLPQVETRVSDPSKSGEVFSEGQLKMPCGNSAQNISFIGSPQECGPPNIKFLPSPMKTSSSMSQTLPASESSVVASKLILQTPMSQGATVTPVQNQNFAPLCESPPYVATLPSPQRAPTTKVRQPPTATSTVSLSAVAQGPVQQTVQQDVTQNLASASVSSLPLTSVKITPVHSSALRLLAPKILSQGTSIIPVLPNMTQAVSSPHAPFGNNCQLFHCVQSPCLAQNEVVAPAISQTVNVTQKNVVEQSSTQSSPQVTPEKKVVKMTLKEVSAAIKKSPQKVSHTVKSVSVASQGTSEHTSTSSRKQDSGTTVIVTRPVRRRGCPPPSLKSFVSSHSKNIDPVYASKSKLSEVASEVVQSDVPKDLLEVGAELKSPQSSEVKSNEGISGAATSSVTIQKGKPSSQLNQNNLLLGKTGSLSLDNLKTSIAKKLPLKLLSKPESSAEKLKTSENVVQKGVPVKDSIQDAALSDRVSILLVPVSIPPTSMCYSGSTSQNIAQVSVTQKLLCSTPKAKKLNLLDAESYVGGSKSRKHNKIPVTTGDKDPPLEISHSAVVTVHSPTKTRCAAPSTKCTPADLSQTSDFKIIHPLTPVQPPISDVSKKVSSAEASSGTSKDDSGVASPNKLPKTTTNVKEIQPKIKPPQPKISQAPTVGANCGTVLDSPCHVPNVSTSSPSQSCYVVPSELPSHGVPGIPLVVGEMTLGAGKPSKVTESQYSTMSPPGLKAFETLLNEGLDSITQLLTEKALACKESWHTDVCFSFLSACLKEKDTFFNPSAEDLNFEAICCAMNKTYPKLNTTVSDCNERWWEFVVLYEILTKKLECHQLNECLLIPEGRRKGITMICQAMAYRKYPLSHKKFQKRNRNDRVNAALKFLNDSLENEMDKASACNIKGTSPAAPPDSVHQRSDIGQLGFVDLFMLLAIKIQQFMQSTEFYANYIGEALTALAEGHSAS